MPRYSIDYGREAVYIGPSPSSGYHFLSYSGVLNNDIEFSHINRNLIADITRVQSFTYEFNVERTNILNIGRQSILSKPIINYPTVDIGFDYVMNGIRNESRMGLNVNYAHFEQWFTGTPEFSDNFTADVLSGLTSRVLTQKTEDPFWPPYQREPKNIFLAISKSGEEIETSPFNWNSGDFIDKVSFNVRDYDVVGFGNCYLMSYTAKGAVGELPIASVKWIAENVNFYPSGSGCWTPAIEPQFRTIISGKHFNIPAYYSQEGPSALKPGDMSVDILVNQGSTTASTTDIDFTDLWIDSFSLGLDLPRESLHSIGFMHPIDRRINYPVFANLAFGAVVNEHQTGTLFNTLNHDFDYNVTLKMKNPGCSSNYQDTIPYLQRAVAIRYDFNKAKLTSSAWSDSIGGRKRISFSFITELTPDLTGSGGFFMSGLLNTDYLEDYLLYENSYGGASSGDSEYLLLENGTQMVTALLPVVV